MDNCAGEPSIFYRLENGWVPPCSQGSLEVKLRAVNHNVVRFVVLAVSHKMLMKQTSCNRHIFSREPFFMAQVFNMFLPLMLEK